MASVVDLLQSHPRLAGIHINIEPMPSGNNDFLILLGELRQAVPDSTILSVAAFPPPSLWHQFSNVHWGESYFRQVSERVDQLAVTMYDTAIKWPKLYQRLMSGWTSDVLAWGEDSKVLLGIPVYDDSGVGYHFPEVENLQNALLGIHAGLASFEELPTSYSGVAIYCEWEMDDQEWQLLKTGFAS